MTLTQKNKMFWHGISLALPVFIFAFVIYTNSYLQHFQDTISMNIWQEKIQAGQRLAKTIDEFIAKGYDPASDKQLFEDIINTSIQILDTEEGVFAVALDYEFAVCTPRYFDNPEDPDPLFLPEFRNTVYEALLSGQSSGYITVNWRNSNYYEVYYQALPAGDRMEWAVIGVSKDSMIDNLNSNRLKLSVFIIGIILIIAFEYLIYIGMRERSEHD